ncbi:MAG: tetratricopeptide repeat protein [Brevinema sp.]
MIKPFLFFLVLFFFTYPYAQNTQNIYPNYENSPAFSSDALHRLYIVGLQYLNSGELTQAEIAFRSIIAFPPRSQDWRTTRYYQGKANLYLGDIYFIQKKYPQSTRHYQIVVQEYAEIEEYSMTLYKLGRSMILNKQEARGIEVLKDYNYKYGTKDRVADNILYWIAQGYIGLQDFTTALQILYQILRDFPDSAMAYDVRVLATKLETDFKNPVDTRQIQQTHSSNQMAINNISEEKELIDRIKQMLILKENLLQLKEKKLDLLESVGKTRNTMLKEKNIPIQK